MKTLLKIIIGFGMILNINAQNLDRTSFKISVKDNNISTLKLNQKLVVMKGLQIDLSPQLGNLIMTRIEARKAKIILKEYYNDFDFGFNLGITSIFKKDLKLKALYNIGMIKFEKSDVLKTKGYCVQLSIDYVF